MAKCYYINYGIAEVSVSRDSHALISGDRIKMVMEKGCLDLRNLPAINLLNQKKKKIKPNPKVHKIYEANHPNL